MCYVVSVTFYMPWMFVYVILMLTGMFRLSCLYVFYHDFGSYMIYNLTVIFVLSYLNTYEHVDHCFYIHMNIYDAMLQLFIIIYIITIQLLFFRIKLCRKFSKFLTFRKNQYLLHFCMDGVKKGKLSDFRAERQNFAKSICHSGISLTPVTGGHV
jgi:hypothetical protein